MYGGVEKLFKDNFDENFMNDQSNQEIWKGVYNIPDEEIWNMRKRLKTKLISYIKWKCGRDWLKSQVDPALGVSISRSLIRMLFLSASEGALQLTKELIFCLPIWIVWRGL